MNIRTLTWTIILFILMGTIGYASDKHETTSSIIDLPSDVRQSVLKNTEQIRIHFSRQAQHLFDQEPLGFNIQTLERAGSALLSVPGRLPGLWKYLSEQARLLGFTGSTAVFLFLIFLILVIAGRKRLHNKMISWSHTFKPRIHRSLFPVITALITIVSTSAIPIGLYFLFTLIQLLLHISFPWFLLIGQLLKIWAIGSFFLSLLKELLGRDFLPISRKSSDAVYRFSRFIIKYVMVCFSIYYIAAAFQISSDILSLLKCLLYISIDILILLFLLKKQSIMEFIPRLPYRVYQIPYHILDTAYYPIVYFTFFIGLLWCFGFHNFSRFLLRRTWGLAIFFFASMSLFHWVWSRMGRLKDGTSEVGEAAGMLYRTLKIIVLAASILIIFLISLRILDFYDPFKWFVSFPLIIIGSTTVSLWTLFKSVVIMLAFIYGAKLIQAYLDYTVYPRLELEEGLAYSINMFIGYSLIAIGGFTTLRILGFDLKVLMVFAGAIGIGIGFGLQSMAANLISGFVLIFGRRIAKGDWIEINKILGMVQEVKLSVTRIRTRDNVEILIPNTDLTSDMIINYTLTEPEIRIRIPVGVSYDADPEVVRKILLETARSDEFVHQAKSPEVWFSEYGESSINFELLVWIDIRHISREDIRSRLYFKIFEALEKAGIQIPYPQRDIHIIRSNQTRSKTDYSSS